jgi:multiple sugar transport system permease protein
MSVVNAARHPGDAAAATAPLRPGRRRQRRPVRHDSQAHPFLEAVGIPLTLFFVMFPILWMALTSFKPRGAVYRLDLLFEPTLQNFVTILQPPRSFGALTINSMLVSSGTVLIAIPLATLAAYGFSRLTFRGNRTIFIGLLATQFIPPVALALPMFILFRDLNLLDTRTGLIIINLSIIVPYSTWLIKGFIDSVPLEIEQAAMVDGCGPLAVIFRVVFPLALPGIMVATVFAFVASWNEFLYPLLLTSRDAVTLPVGLMRTLGAEGIMWEQMSAGGMLVMVPMLVLSFAIRKYFSEGITLGAVK